MSIKGVITVRDKEAKSPFPKLMIDQDTNTVILATGRDFDYITGMVVSHGGGDYSDSWTDVFTDFKGEITLSNE